MTMNPISNLLRVFALFGGALLALAFFVDQPELAAEQSDPQQHAGAESISIRLENYAAGLVRPLGIANAGDLRLFVIEQAGRIRIIHPDGSVQATPFLDIRGRVDDSDSEEGLLGLAFHPQYEANGYFYVNYTNTSDGIRRTRISRFSVTSDPNSADPNSETVLLTVLQPNWNHNAGRIAFGPDGFLYIPLGDGGGAGDRDDNAQNNSLLLGKISRIDVNANSGWPADCKGLGTGEYTIPIDNPMIDGPGKVCDEIWASGLRNPWQSTFDSLTGDLFVADVGQSKVEEVNFQPAASEGGQNYGWRCYEGSQVYNTDGCALPDTYTFPIFEYERPTGFGDCSVTGGFVYRGHRYDALYGRYFLTDYCSGRFWDLLKQPDGSWLATVHVGIFPPDAGSTFGNAAFGQRCDGELFVANVALGKIFHLTGSGSAHPQPGPRTIEQETATDVWAYLPLIATSSCR